MVASVFVAGVVVAIRASKTSALERKNAQEEKQRVERANQSAIDSAGREAANLTSSLMRTYESSTKTASELPQHIAHASSWLQRADLEFKDNAFGPFWDAVENAARQLAEFNDKVNQLSRLASEYYRNLDGRNHTFPVFPARRDNIPSPSNVANELRRIVRMGQTNFQFANIWEHRRTREVLIAGFRTLGEAVSNLGSTIERSVYGLEESVSSDVARLVQEEIKTRETLEARTRRR